jgi:predicted metal-binding protein
MGMTDTYFTWAKEAGFTAASPLNMAALRAQDAVRAMCASDRCHAYGKNWTCPPVCGTLAECAARMAQYTAGILLQTEGPLEDEFDFESMQALEQAHLASLHRFAARLREAEPDALILGSGGCRVCKTCAYPDPCRFPQKACSSMEAYGLVVSEVCRESGVPYYYGKNTLCYSACCLVGKKAGI